MSLQMSVARSYQSGGVSPSFFGSIGNFVKGVAGGAVDLLTGNVTGAVGSVLQGVGIGGPKKTTPVGNTVGAYQPTQTSPGAVPNPGVTGMVQRLAPGGSTGYSLGSGPPPKGYRLNKSSYFLKNGTYVAKGTKYVKIRRRNSLNPKALSRAMARLEGAKRFQHRLKEYTTPHYTAAGARKEEGSHRRSSRRRSGGETQEVKLRVVA